MNYESSRKRAASGLDGALRRSPVYQMKIKTWCYIEFSRDHQRFHRRLWLICIPSWMRRQTGNSQQIGCDAQHEEIHLSVNVRARTLSLVEKAFFFDWLWTTSTCSFVARIVIEISQSYRAGVIDTAISLIAHKKKRLPMPFLSATPHHNDAIFNILIWSRFGETIVIKSFLRAGRGSHSTKKYHVVAWDLIPLCCAGAEDGARERERKRMLKPPIEN